MWKVLGQFAAKNGKDALRVAGGTVVSMGTFKLVTWVGDGISSWNSERKAKNAAAAAAAQQKAA